MPGRVNMAIHAKNLLGFGFESGKVFQFGFLVENINTAMAFYKGAGFTGPFTCFRNFTAPNGNYRGSMDCPLISIAHAFSGNVYMELIEQLDDTPSVYTEHRDVYGYGLHHLGIAVAPSDYDEIMAYFYANGFEDVFTDELPTGARIRYIAPKGEDARKSLREKAGVCYFEFVEAVPGEEEFFLGLREAADVS